MSGLAAVPSSDAEEPTVPAVGFGSNRLVVSHVWAREDSGVLSWTPSRLQPGVAGEAPRLVTLTTRWQDVECYEFSDNVRFRFTYQGVTLSVVIPSTYVVLPVEDNRPVWVIAYPMPTEGTPVIVGRLPRRHSLLRRLLGLPVRYRGIG